MSYSGITEERTRGWGPGFFIAVVLMLVLVVVVFVMLWIATGVAETAALVTMLAILVLVIVGMILLAFSTGSKQAHDADRDIVASMAAIVTARNEPALPEIPLRQLPEPASWIVNGSTMQRADRIQSAAQKVYLALKPQNIPPTRDNIKRVTGETSHEFASTVISWLEDRQLVDVKGKGAAPMWRNE